MKISSIIFYFRFLDNGNNGLMFYNDWRKKKRPDEHGSQS